MRWNLKEAVSKSLVRRTEITYKARLREISWQNTTKSNNYHICSSRVNVAYIWRERACTLSVEYQWSFIWMLRLINWIIWLLMCSLIRKSIWRRSRDRQSRRWQKLSEWKQEAAHKEVSKVRGDKAR